MAAVATGLEQLLARPPGWVKSARLGLLCNPASVDRRLRHARALIAERFPGRLAALYAPQHGFFAEKQDNMVESPDMVDPLLGVPVFSLYGTTRIPTAEMLAPIDVLLVDLQDVGTRVYTFMTTVAHCMEQAAVCGKKVVVLDRPNPLGGSAVEGNLLDTRLSSFVGRYPIPMRHGMTAGELAVMFNQRHGIGCELEVIPMAGWRRSMYFEDTGLPWVAPSPNLPTPASAVVYPGQVIWEGTNLSEGRGTTQPFELFGAPWLDPQQVLAALAGNPPAGVVLRPVVFEPTANKWCGQPCRGFQLHVADRRSFRPYRTALALLQAVIGRHRDEFAWKPPPYEYEHDKLPIDLIIGDTEVRERLESLAPLSEIEADWQPALADFEQERRAYLIYGP